MTKQYSKAHRSVARQIGFTLVEMAVVLVIIGLILGAISVGKDVQRNAEYQKVINKYGNGWKKTYDEYYQRTGVVVGDSQTSPTYMVDGGQAIIGSGTTSAGGNLDGSVAGIPENFTNTGKRICHGQGYVENTVGADDPPLEDNVDLHDLMDRIGVRMPPGRGEGREDRYVYNDSNGNATELQVCFQWNPPGTISGAGNVMVIRGLTPDLARLWDQTVDGKPDALEGRFRQQNEASNDSEPSSQRPGTEWGSNNTYQYGANSQTAQGTGRDKDEDRVALVTAHWVMDQ